MEPIDKKKQKKIILASGLALFILLFVWMGVSLLADYTGSVTNPMTSFIETVEVEVTEGASTAKIAEELKEEGVISYPTFFRLMSRFGGHDGTFKQGTFIVPKDAGYGEIFSILTDGSRAKQDAVKVTIPEGFELRQIADRLAEVGLVDRAVFMDLVENGDFDFAFVRDIPKRENRLEGYLFPDTYLFSKDNTEEDIIRAMLSQFERLVYTEENIKRAKELGYSMDEVVTLASIVEREALGDEDRRDVSAVFHNRLNSSSYPYLQSCATVQYILKERKPVLSIADTKIESPYNTYRNKGLPIGPIASPGVQAVEAALHPSNSDALFFVLGSDGKHHFSKTFDEHKQNKNGM